MAAAAARSEAAEGGGQRVNRQWSGGWIAAQVDECARLIDPDDTPIAQQCSRAVESLAVGRTNNHGHRSLNGQN